MNEAGAGWRMLASKKRLLANSPILSHHTRPVLIADGLACCQQRQDQPSEEEELFVPSRGTGPQPCFWEQKPHSLHLLQVLLSHT